MTNEDPILVPSGDPSVRRWGYKLNGREFVAYQHDRQYAVDLFAKVLDVPIEHVDPIVVELGPCERISLFEGRAAPGA